MDPGDVESETADECMLRSVLYYQIAVKLTWSPWGISRDQTHQMVNKIKGNWGPGFRADQPSGFKTRQQIESVAGGFITTERYPEIDQCRQWRARLSVNKMKA